MICVRCSSVSLNAVDELLVGRRIVRGARVGGVIAIARNRGAGVEVHRCGEALPDKVRADYGSVLCDELAVGFVLEQKLRGAGDEERIGDAEDDRRDECVEDSGDNVAAHDCPLCQVNGGDD